jgi:hypothetical protein
MAQVSAAAGGKERPVVLGIRISAGLRTNSKVEATWRDVTIAELFEEMWQAYLERQHVRSR